MIKRLLTFMVILFMPASSFAEYFVPSVESGGMNTATYDPQAIAGDAFDLAVHTGTIAHDGGKITNVGTNAHTAIDSHIADTSDPHGITLTQTAATIAGIAAPYIAQSNGTGAGITLAGNTNMPSGIWNSGGNVGVGTTTPATALHVIGTVTVSSGIIVSGSTMTVPDYVFAEDYKLLPIEELKEFVRVNQHLPEFESAKNTKQLNLVQDNMNLREAIEKLTLYIFDIKQEITELKGKN